MRKEIRNLVKEHLSTGTQAEDRVFVNRENPIAEDGVYPVILIYSGPEAADTTPMQSVYSRTYSLVIEARIRHSDQVDDDLDDIAKEIETRMKVFRAPGVKGVFYTGVDPEQDNEGEELYGALKLGFDFKYIS